jgi:hypothetical protein
MDMDMDMDMKSEGTLVTVMGDIFSKLIKFFNILNKFDPSGAVGWIFGSRKTVRLNGKWDTSKKGRKDGNNVTKESMDM